MKYLYYPGCALYTKAKNFDYSTIESFKVLGIVLEEIPNWTCCGTAFPLMDDNLIGLMASARNLANASQHGNEILTGCSCCYNALKRTNYAIRQDEEKRKKINLHLRESFGKDYNGEVEVFHLLEFLRDNLRFESLRKFVKNELNGLKVAPFYGCLLLRPLEEIGLDDHENPKIFEGFLQSLGAEPIDFPLKTKCCGTYLTVKYPGLVNGPSQQIIASVRQAGAEAIVVSCPLCFYNLEQCQLHAPEDKKIPVFYFTQLLAKALGVEKWQRK